MHELSLAHSVMEIVGREMEKYPSRHLKSIELTIGTHAGVETEAFRTAIQAVMRSSLWPDAEAVIVTVAAEAQCIACGARFAPDGYIPQCPECGSAMCGIVAGNEFRVSALTLHDT